MPGVEAQQVELPEAPCELTVSSPPPFSMWEDPAAWASWWGDCLPSGPVGPGARGGCDLEDAWFAALSFCEQQCRERMEADLGMTWAEIIAAYGDPCGDMNFVDYAWVGENCQVLDASCATVHDVHPAIWAGALGIVVLGLLWPDDIEPDPDLGVDGSGEEAPSQQTSPDDGSDGAGGDDASNHNGSSCNGIVHPFYGCVQVPGNPDDAICDSMTGPGGVPECRGDPCHAACRSFCPNVECPGEEGDSGDTGLPGGVGDSQVVLAECPPCCPPFVLC
jgi:hypothetical protein